MTEYISIHKQSDKKFYLKYDSFGVFKSISLEGERWTEEQVLWVLKSSRVPKTETEYWKFMERKDLDFEYFEIPKYLSFEYFWKTYGHKVGKVPATRKAWQALSDAEKIEALLYIPKLRMKKKIDNTAMPYPSTYLNGRYWQAEKI